MATVNTDPWVPIENAALAVFSPQINSGALTLVRVIRQSLRYAVVDDQQRQIVIDKRAFLLSILSVGSQDTPSIAYGNTATWCAHWLETRVGQSAYLQALSSAMTGTDRVVGPFHDGYTVVPSVSMHSILKDAGEIARQTVGRDVADMRHVFAAMLRHTESIWSMLPQLGLHVAAADLPAFKMDFLKAISAAPEPLENIEEWDKVLFGGAGRTDGPDPKTKPVDRAVFIPEFSSDRTTLAGTSGHDALGIQPDVKAFARLICYKDATTPLSIGIFGGWGSGKSTFMERLEAEIYALTDAEAQRREQVQDHNGMTSAQPASGSAPRFVANVIQVRFNAWHFADANLWASLSAAFFDQLRSGGYARQGKEIHARLVEQVNSVVHSLSEAVEATRKAATDGDRTLVEAQKNRDKAVKEVDRAQDEVFSQSLIDAVGAAFEARKGDLAALGMPSSKKVDANEKAAESNDVADNDVDGSVKAAEREKAAESKKVDDSVSDFLDLAKDVTTFRGRARTIGRFLIARWWRLPVLLLAALAIAAIYVVPLVGMHDVSPLLQFATLIATLTAAGTIIAPAVRIIASVMASTAAFADKLDKVRFEKTKELVTSEAKLRVAAEEAAARRAAEERATRALARYIDPKATTNPQRLLRFVLEDDPDTRALEKEIGLISRARRLFQVINEIVKTERGKSEAGEATDPSVPDRIVLYIDDLDRCTHEQVYAVLQAIHLLLAFELFVVVVGVDVRWIQEAIAVNAASARATKLGQNPTSAAPTTTAAADAAEVALRRLAVSYLEKIFQLPFWLRPLSVDSERGNSYGAYVQEMLGSNVAKAAAQPAHDPAPNVSDGPNGSNAPQPGPKTNPSPDPPDGDKKGATIEEALETMKLTPEEVAFLASPAVGQLAAREPRGVKRLINVYRIARARMSPEERTKLLGTDGGAPTYPLLAVMIAVETGQLVEIADALHAGLDTAPPQQIVVSETPNPQGPLAAVFAMSEPLRAAFDAAHRERKGKNITAAECTPISRLTRRYSFNRYQ